MSLFAPIDVREESIALSNSPVPAMMVSFLMMLSCVDDALFTLPHILSCGALCAVLSHFCAYNLDCVY